MIPDALDFRFLMAQYYKRIGLNDEEFAVIMMIDHLLQQGNELITSDVLSLKMTSSSEVLDKVLVNLLNKGLIDYNYSSATSGSMTTSLVPLRKRLYREFQLDLAQEQENDNSTQKSQLENIFSVYQKELARQLSPAETQRIREWFAYGYSEKVIIDALHEALSKNRRSIKSIDKILLQWSTADDVAKEGFSLQNENWDQDIDQTIETAKKKWFNFDDED